MKFNQEKLNESTEKLIQEIKDTGDKYASEIKKIKLFSTTK